MNVIAALMPTEQGPARIETWRNAPIHDGPFYAGSPAYDRGDRVWHLFDKLNNIEDQLRSSANHSPQ